MKNLAISVDRPDCLVLFRSYVSRSASSKAKAVLEGVGLDSDTIKACFRNNPLNDEEAVQARLIKWKDGQGRSPLLLKAMEYARVGQQHTDGLKMKLCLNRGNILVHMLVLY